MFTITKKFSGYPFAHRQPNHSGHCKFIHGHNWDFEICLAAKELDKNNFVYDFGKFGWLKEYLKENFDHTLLINEDDPQKDYLYKHLSDTRLAQIRIVPNCSSEGLAKLVFEELQNHFKNVEQTDRVWVKWVKVYEDHKNTAIFEPNMLMHLQINGEELVRALKRKERDEYMEGFNEIEDALNLEEKARDGE